MSRRIQTIVGIVAVAFIGLLFWPIFVEGEPILPISLAAFLAAGAVLAYFALKSNAHWARYALLGVIPGFFIGGFGLGLLVWSNRQRRRRVGRACGRHRGDTRRFRRCDRGRSLWRHRRLPQGQAGAAGRVEESAFVAPRRCVADSRL